MSTTIAIGITSIMIRLGTITANTVARVGIAIAHMTVGMMNMVARFGIAIADTTADTIVERIGRVMIGTMATDTIVAMVMITIKIGAIDSLISLPRRESASAKRHTPYDGVATCLFSQ